MLGLKFIFIKVATKEIDKFARFSTKAFMCSNPIFTEVFLHIILF